MTIAVDLGRKATNKQIEAQHASIFANKAGPIHDTCRIPQHKMGGGWLETPETMIMSGAFHDNPHCSPQSDQCLCY